MRNFYNRLLGVLRKVRGIRLPEAVVTWILLIISASLCAYSDYRYLTVIPRGYDETMYYEYAKNILHYVSQHSNAENNVSLYKYTPGYPVSIAIFLKLFGDSLSIPAWVTLCYSIGIVVVAFLIVLRLTEDRMMAFCSSLILGLNPQFNIYGSRVMSDIPAFFFAFLSLYFLVRYLHVKKQLHLFLFIIVGLVSPLFHAGEVIFVIAASIMFFTTILSSYNTGRKWKGLLFVTVASLVIGSVIGVVVVWRFSGGAISLQNFNTKVANALDKICSIFSLAAIKHMFLPYRDFGIYPEYGNLIGYIIFYIIGLSKAENGNYFIKFGHPPLLLPLTLIVLLRRGKLRNVGLFLLIVTLCYLILRSIQYYAMHRYVFLPIFMTLVFVPVAAYQLWHSKVFVVLVTLFSIILPNHYVPDHVAKYRQGSIVWRRIAGELKKIVAPDEVAITNDASFVRVLLQREGVVFKRFFEIDQDTGTVTLKKKNLQHFLEKRRGRIFVLEKPFNRARKLFFGPIYSEFHNLLLETTHPFPVQVRLLWPGKVTFPIGRTGYFTHHVIQVVSRLDSDFCGVYVDGEGNILQHDLMRAGGLYAVVIGEDPQDYKVYAFNTFDRYTESERFREMVDELKEGSVVALCITGKAFYNFTSEAQEAIYMLGGSYEYYRSREKGYILIGTKGAPPGTAIEHAGSGLIMVSNHVTDPIRFPPLWKGKGLPFSVRIMSAGWLAGNRCDIQVDNGPNLSLSKRGFNLVILDMSNGITATSYHFDTWLSYLEAEDMAELIESLPQETVVLACVKDEASKNLSPRAQRALHLLGAKMILEDRYWYGYALVGFKGAAFGDALEKMDLKKQVVLKNYEWQFLQRR